MSLGVPPIDIQFISTFPTAEGQSGILLGPLRVRNASSSFWRLSARGNPFFAARSLYLSIAWGAKILIFTGRKTLYVYIKKERMKKEGNLSAFFLQQGFG